MTGDIAEYFLLGIRTMAEKMNAATKSYSRVHIGSRVVSRNTNL
jgi:hypothetical protein